MEENSKKILVLVFILFFGVINFPIVQLIERTVHEVFWLAILGIWLVVIVLTRIIIQRSKKN